MADAATFTSKLSVTASNVTVTNATSSKTTNVEAALSNVAVYHATQLVTDTIEAVALGDILVDSTNGKDYVVRLENKSNTYSVQVKIGINVGATPNTYSLCGSMEPLEAWGPVRMRKMTGNSTTKEGVLFIGANAGSAMVEVVAGQVGAWE